MNAPTIYQGMGYCTDPASAHMGKSVVRRFDRGVESAGVVVGHMVAGETAEELEVWLVIYGDGDREDLEEVELREAITLAEQHANAKTKTEADCYPSFRRCAYSTASDDALTVGKLPLTKPPAMQPAVAASSRPKKRIRKLISRGPGDVANPDDVASDKKEHIDDEPALVLPKKKMKSVDVTAASSYAGELKADMWQTIHAELGAERQLMAAHTVSDVAAWLTRIGYAQHAEMFRHQQFNTTDDVICAELDQEDLEELGIPQPQQANFLREVKQLSAPQAAPPQQPGDTGVLSAASHVHTSRPAGLCFLPTSLIL